MANIFSVEKCVLDTFTSAIDVAVGIGFPTGKAFKVKKIVWQNPTTVGHTAIITDGVGGPTVFTQTCTTALQSIKDDKIGLVGNLNIAASGVASGTVLIVLDRD